MRKVKKKKKNNIKEIKPIETKQIKEKELKEKRNLENNKEENIKNKNNNIKSKKENQKIKQEEVKNKKKRSKHRSRAKNNNQKHKKHKRSIWKKLLTAILILGIICIIAIAGFFTYIVVSSPKFDENAFNVKDQTVVYDIKGEIIAKLGVQNRESVTYDQLPQVLIDAIIATEDSRFYQHNGVDLPRFIKATIQQLIGQEAGGASTLTMQVVKNNLTKKETVEKNKIEKIIRKFQDVYLSVFKVEKEYAKEEIIELYVNNYGLGSSVYGVGEASKYYFGKSVSELTLPEAALIAGLFQAPNRHNPYKNIESATSRRNLVLNLMVRHGYITKEEADMAKSISIESLLVGAEDKTEYQGFVDTVIQEIENLTGHNPEIVPMKIYTTMEKSIQDGINSVLENDAWYWKDNNVQSGIAVVNVETGAIAAVGAGRNRTGKRQFNYATQAKKQPGSTAKPIFAYGAGFEYNNYSTYTMFVDEPWSYTNGPSINNWNGTFEGIMTTRYALQYSRNIPALKSYQNIGSKKIQQFAYSLGLDVSLNQNSENYKVLKEETGLDNTINEAYSIGGVAEGFTPLEMAAAYSGFASGGYYTTPYSVTKIEYRETGEVIEYKPTKERVMKDSTAYLMNNILESAVEVGFNGGARVYGSHVAAKTGTTNYSDNIMKKYNLPSHAVNDLWTIAYTSQYSIAVWYGYDSVAIGYNSSNGGHKDGVMKAVIQYIPKDTKGWKAPSSVIAVQVGKETWPAKLPSEYTPANMITTEYFIKGTQPTEVSERYARLNDITNTKIDVTGNEATITWDYKTPTVLTDEYLTNYFNKPVFGNSKKNLMDARKTYNTNTLGNIGFAIYKQNEDKTLELLTYTTEKTYTYTGYDQVTLVIKAEHQKFKSNASIGTKLDITLSSSEKLNLTSMLNGKGTEEAKVGEYKEKGIKNAYYGSTDVTSLITVKYQIIDNNEITEFETEQSFEEAINKLPEGTYKVNYIITYKDKEITKNRIINLK